MKLKKIMALVLCFAMVLSTMSFNVFAEGETVSVSTLDQLQEALVADDDRPIVITETIVIPADTEVTIDLNGKTIDADWADEAAGKHIYVLENNGTLEISGVGVINTRGIFNYGELTLSGGIINAIDCNGGYGVINYSGADFTMNGGTLAAVNEDGDPAEAGYYDATALRIDSGAFAEIIDGNISSVSNYTYAVDVAGTLDVSGGTIKGRGGISVVGGNVTITDGNILNDIDNDATGHAVYVEAGNVTIEGGNFTATNDENDGNSVVYVASGATAEITGGTFVTNEFTKAPYGPEGTTISISGGNFDKAPADAYIADGFELDDDGNVVGSTPAETIVAKVGGVPYTDIQEAIVAAAPDGTVEIVNDVAVDEWVMIAERLTISNDDLITLVLDGLTIDGNGHTLTINSIESAGNGGYLFFDASELNVNDLTIKYADGLVGGIGLKDGTLSNVTFDGGVYGVMPQTGEVTITGCTFKTNGTSVYFEEERDNLIVTGCTFNNADTANVILLRGDVTFTDNIVNSGRTVNIVSGSPVVSGNNLNNVRLKVYAAATGTVSNNTINNLVFEDTENTTNTVFSGNILSAEAQTVLDAATAPATPAVTFTVGNVMTSEDATTLEEAIELTEYFYEMIGNVAILGAPVITLEADYEFTAPVVIDSEYPIIIDLNGHAMTYDSTTQGEAMITNKGTLTINDSSDPDTGVINYNYTGAADSTYGKGNYTISNGGTLTVNGGKITIANLRGHAKYPIDNNSTSGDAILVINDGHLYNYNTSAIRQFCNSSTNLNSVTINGGLIEGYCTIWVQNPSSTATANAVLSITNGEFKTTAAAYVNGTSALKDVASRIYCSTDGGAWSDDSAISITGGTFNENVKLSTNAPASITVSEDATFNGYVSLPVANVGDQTFESLQAAVNAAEAGQTVKLLNDVKITGKFTINKAITIDGNGHSIIADETATWYTEGNFGMKSYKTHLIGVNSSGVTLKNIVLDNNNLAAGINIYCAQNVVFDNVSIINATKGMAALTVNGSTLTVKNQFKALGNSIAIDISNGSGVTSALGLTVEEGTVLDLGNKTVKFASVAVNDMTGAIKADGTPYFAAMDNAYYYTISQMESRTTAYSNGLTLLADVELSKDISVKGTLDPNGHTFTIADGEIINVNSNITVSDNGTINADFCLTEKDATITGSEGFNVTTTVEGYAVKYAAGKYSLEQGVVKIGETLYATLDDALTAAKAAGMTDVEITVLDDITFSTKVKDFTKVTFNGTERKQTIDMNVGIVDVACELVFNDLTISRVDSDWLYKYTYIHGGTTYNNCKMIGLFNVTVADTTFNKCDFYNDDTFGDGSYSLWLYNCREGVEVNITDCTFDVYERAIKMYGNGYNNTMTLNISGTEFVSRTADKTVVEMAYDNATGKAKMNLNINSSTKIGFGDPEHIEGEANAWFNVEGTKTGSTVCVDGAIVYTDCEAKIGDAYYLTLAEAIDAAEDGETITLMKDCTNDVTVTQAPDKKITIDGNNKTMSGTITVDGKSARYETAGLTIKNVNFDTSNISKDASINLGGNNSIRYTSNVTVENCTFSGTYKTNGAEKVGIKSYTGGDHNLVVTGCTATGMHSLIQLKNVEKGLTITDCEIKDSKNGISIGRSTGVNIEGCKIDTDSYGIRADGEGAYTATVKDCTISAELPIVVRKTTAAYDLSLEGTNTLTTTGANNYQVVFTSGDDGTYNAPETTFSFASSGELNVFPEFEVKIGDVGYATLEKAVNAANNGDTITLISGDKVISAAASVTGGKTITITGDAIVDWTKGNLMIGRGGEGDGKVIFKNANIKSAVKKTVASTGFHVSANDKDNAKTNTGTLEIIDSYIEVDYLIQRNYTKVDNSEVVVYGGTYIHGRPASETADGVDGTATMDVVNGSTFTIVNPNGMGVGGEGNGVLNIVDSTMLSKMAEFPVNAKGKVTSNGSILEKGLAVKSGATVSITAGTYSFDPTAYLADNLFAVKSKITGLYTVTGKRTVSLIANGTLDATDNKGIVVKTGETFTVDVKVSGIEAGGVKWIIDYDETKFKLQSVDFKGNKVSQNNNNVDIDMYGTLADGEVVATYTFMALNDAVVNSPFDLTYAELLTVDEAWQEMDVTDITEAVNTESTIELREIIYTVKFDGADTTLGSAQFAYTGDPHTFEVNVSEPADATIKYTINGKTATAGELSIIAEGVWEIGYTIEKAGYAEESGIFTLTISKPDYKVEVDVSEAGDYVSGYKLVLVYTDAKDVTFDFDGIQMLDASDSQYMYNNTDKYDNVFALVVKSLGVNSTLKDYEDLVTVDYKDDAANIDYSVANDVNFSKTVNFNDIVSAYSVLEINKNAFENYMAGVIKTDVNFSRNATDMDTTPIIAEVYGSDEN